MKQIVIKKAGGFERLEMEEAPEPTPGPGEVLVEVHAVSVNFADCLTRMGVYPEARAIGFPLVPGFDTAGVVLAVGSGVTIVQPGDRVVAVGYFGGYATHRVVPELGVYPLPDSMSFEEGATIPVGFLTAFYSLDERARIRPGETVLVHSAAGGLGSAAVQIAKLLGARVIAAVGSSHKGIM